jgi:hypothetical protein
VQNPLSDFDQGMSDAQELGAFIEMPDAVTILGVTMRATVTDRSIAQKNIRGGKSREVSGSVNVMTYDFKRSGASMAGGDSVTFSDGETGKISIVDDCAGPIVTLRIGPVLQGAAGPDGGAW